MKRKYLIVATFLWLQLLIAGFIPIISVLKAGLPQDTATSDTISPAGGTKDEYSAGTNVSPENIPNRDQQNPWLWKVNYFGKSFKLVNALIITIVICTVSMVILLIIILLNRNRMEREQKLRQFLLEKYQSLIVEYLYGDIVSDEFLKIASDSFRRQVLIDQIIDVSINLKGDSEQKLNELYLQLGLQEDSIRKAFSRKWHRKVKGFRELAFMNIRDANDEIYKALNSANEILRMEAQIALVRLSGENPFMFLYQLRRPFSLWEQISLYELLIQHNLSTPSFKQWLDSPNPTVIMFSLRMVREFKQKDAEENVCQVLSHPESRVKHLAIEVAGDLNMQSSLDIMKRMYKNEEYNNCVEILRSMAKMPDPSMLGFLKLVLDKEDDVQLQIEATRAIENMGEVGVAALVKLMKSEYKNYNIIIRHVLDRRIN
jgi:HEAT repeat protein